MQAKQFSKYKLPDSSGVYFFLGKRKEILYIGRATTLRDRVRSYFSHDLSETRGPKIVKMINDAKSIDFRKTDSVLEAVLLEADLIKKFKPPYNTDDKDDKSFNCVVITDEDFPRVLVVRKKDLESDLFADRFSLLATYGPFPEGGKLAVALKIIRKIFPYRDNKCTPNQGKPCFNRQIGLCAGVCTGEISKKEYGRLIQNIRRLFEGKKATIVRALTQDMKRYAKLQEFEKAVEIRRQLFALQHISDVALISSSDSTQHPYKLEFLRMRIEAFDVAHTAGKETVGVMTVVQGTQVDKNAYRLFKIKNAVAGDDVGALKEMLERRFKHTEWGTPNLVVIDGGTAQLNAARRILLQYGAPPIVSVVKDERHRPHHILGDVEYIHKYEQGILLANSEAHRFAISFHRRRRDRIS